MKRTVIATAIVLALVACATFLTRTKPTPGVVTIHAQTLPKTVTIAWDANAASDNVTNYVVRINGVILGSPTTTTQTWVVTAAGTYTVTVRAVNLWPESPDATLVVNVVVPGRPVNVRIQ